jgi:uncharacterized protein with HEPN domain
MTNERTYEDYLADIADALEKIEKFIQGMDFEAFAADDKTTFAVVRGLEIIGEATKMIPDSVRQAYPIVPWKSMAGMRDKLIHHYFGVDLNVVWETAVNDLPALKPQIQHVLDNLDKP